MPNATLALSLCLAGCASAIAMPDTSEVAREPARAAPPPVDVAVADTDLAFARGVGPAALEQMLARYDRMHGGAARAALADRIDKVAAQKYATVSRLYWYTDLDRAKEAAAKAGKPILALRMLGRLDEDLSCANSRFFRTTLYANTEVSAYLKQNFVLYWSSERAVPKVTIDFGDGRTIESTTTGNSAHYILDAKGEVLDVIPGLYSPRAFRAELATSLAHAQAVAAAPASERRTTIVRYQTAKANQIRTASGHLNVYTMRGLRISREDAAAIAQRATVSKAALEVPQLRQITTMELRSIADDEISTWADFAKQLWPRLPAEHRAGISVDPEEMILAHSGLTTSDPSVVFDEQSLALVQTLHGDASATEKRTMLTRLAQTVLADSALNQLRLRPEIATFLSTGVTDFTRVNEFIYTNVFHTPASDPWLGLRPRTVFTGLPNDGVTMPARAAQR